MPIKTRTETDSLGSRKLPMDAPWGIYTARVLANYPQKGVLLMPEEFLREYVKVKMVYAIVNNKHKKISKKTKEAIVKACKKLLTMNSERFMMHFPISQIQSGGGTSTNMNVNEVIANFASKELGGKFGQYLVNPHDDVNCSQSSNDTFPGTTKLTVLNMVHLLHKTLNNTKKILEGLAKKFKAIKKVGRTHMQDAVVITLGDEFSGYARTIGKNIKYLHQATKVLYEVNFGGTATGSKQNISKGIRKDIIKQLKKEFGFPLKQPTNYFEQNSSSGDIAHFSQALSHLSRDMIKIGNDLRFLSSGPMSGIHEIDLPNVQAGSSIMPGKINPSMVEALTMVCAKVIGDVATIEELTQLAQLELQQFMPGVTRAILDAMNGLNQTLPVFNQHCLKGIKPNSKHIKELLDHSFANATDYTKKYGYDRVARAVKEALKTGKTLEEILRNSGKY